MNCQLLKIPHKSTVNSISGSPQKTKPRGRTLTKMLDMRMHESQGCTKFRKQHKAFMTTGSFPENPRIRPLGAYLFFGVLHESLFEGGFKIF